MGLQLLYRRGREMEITVSTHTKNELKDGAYEVPELKIDALLPYLSDWLSDFIMNNSDDT